MERCRKMNVIEVDHVTLRRGTRTLLHDINWTISQGEHWALLGANGSGKTTLLKILTGYEWPTSGRVSVLQKRHGEYDLRRLRKSIGWVSNMLETKLPLQDSALEITGSGFDSSFGLYRELSDGETARCHEALELMRIAPLSSQTFGTLSQGEQKRTLIARALVNEPALLVLDEPCAGLDPASRSTFLDDLGNLVVSPRTPAIIFVTHHIEEIRPWVTHAMVLKNGRITAGGTIDRVVTSDVFTDALSRDCTVVQSQGLYRLFLNP